MQRRKKKTIPSSPASRKLAIKHVPGEVKRVPLTLLPRYLEENKLYPVDWKYGSKSRDWILVLSKEDPNAKKSETQTHE